MHHRTETGPSLMCTRDRPKKYSIGARSITIESIRQHLSSQFLSVRLIIYDFCRKKLKMKTLSAQSCIYNKKYVNNVDIEYSLEIMLLL